MIYVVLPPILVIDKRYPHFFGSMETNTGIERTFRQFPAGPAGADSSWRHPSTRSTSQWKFHGDSPAKWDTHTIPIKGEVQTCLLVPGKITEDLAVWRTEALEVVFVTWWAPKTIVINGVNEITRYKWPYKWGNWGYFTLQVDLFPPRYKTGFLGGPTCIFATCIKGGQTNKRDVQTK